ncbi:potassium voltage-gated channel subfamily S member 2 [Amblyraja radiata]|uniref:potassium voltage-gated channel subfamily S member 2 n=1 Tax=Amblyraja radiata TaxID=386614 RepID=UPI0014032C05|nr:potassium voltage-gated channel subfamily S member 2 [Amblyraja radiata]
MSSFIRKNCNTILLQDQPSPLVPDPTKPRMSTPVRDSLSSGEDMGDGEISINVGGLKRKLSQWVLARFPDTRLGQLPRCHSAESILRLCDDYDEEEKEFYFDRNPALFPLVLNSYHTGRLRVTGKPCIFRQEMEYWGMEEFLLDPPCQGRAPGTDQDDVDETASTRRGSTTSSLNEVLTFYQDASKYDSQIFGSCRRRLWLMFENPGYNIVSRIYSVLSIIMVLGSIATMCLNSMDEFQLVDGEGERRDDPRFEMVEQLCMAWFTLELLARLLVSPGPLHFFSRPLNLIDLMSVSPFYLTLLVNLVVDISPALPNLGRMVQVLRLMRIFRILKLARHSTGLRSLGATLKHSYREVGLLLLYLSVGVSVFSVVAYTVEKEEDSGLTTIPSCWWWATVSMTTVGYGDVVPISIGGKLTASACILSGILVVVLPITLIFNKFSHFYRRQKNLESAMRNCEFDEGLAELPLLNLRDFYADRVKSLMVSLNNMSRGTSTEHSINNSGH